MQSATIIDPKNEKKLFIPSFVEAPEPTNMPAPTELEKWHDMIGKTYSRKEVDPRSYDAKLRYHLTAVVPFHEVEKNEVEYKFNVAPVTGKDANGWNVLVQGGIPQSFFFPCKAWNDNYTLVS
jgi:hypothetical protein